MSCGHNKLRLDPILSLGVIAGYNIVARQLSGQQDGFKRTLGAEKSCQCLGN
jgi:hypothetical protein